MRDITVLVTASGAPGTAALLRALRTNGERGVRIVGTDMSPQAIGRQFCDRFYVVPQRQVAWTVLEQLLRAVDARVEHAEAA